MKKLIGMVAVALAMTLASGAASAADKLKVGFIYVGPIGDHGWTYAHDQGRLALEGELGDMVETVYVENVPEGADAERAIERLARQGAGLIFTTSFGYMEPDDQGRRALSRREVRARDRLQAVRQRRVLQRALP